VKPSNTTAKNTDAPAASNRTKSYGNGSTAGQIAISRGYPASGNLHGPGNSQPHKVVSCGHRHGVDVHALKSRARKHGCGSEPTPTRDPTPAPEGPRLAPDVPAAPSSTPAGPAQRPHGHDPVQKPHRDAGAASNPPASRALAAAGRATDAELPFTGLRLWAIALAGALLVAAGGGLRRQSRARVR
jgi:hypothetical protein